jgi:hypothetical protein
VWCPAPMNMRILGKRCCGEQTGDLVFGAYHGGRFRVERVFGQVTVYSVMLKKVDLIIAIRTLQTSETLTRRKDSAQIGQIEADYKDDSSSAAINSRLMRAIIPRTP